MKFFCVYFFYGLLCDLFSFCRSLSFSFLCHFQAQPTLSRTGVDPPACLQQNCKFKNDLRCKKKIVLDCWLTRTRRLSSQVYLCPLCALFLSHSLINPFGHTAIQRRNREWSSLSQHTVLLCTWLHQPQTKEEFGPRSKPWKGCSSFFVFTFSCFLVLCPDLSSFGESRVGRVSPWQFSDVSLSPENERAAPINTPSPEGVGDES